MIKRIIFYTLGDSNSEKIINWFLNGIGEPLLEISNDVKSDVNNELFYYSNAKSLVVNPREDDYTKYRVYQFKKTKLLNYGFEPDIKTYQIVILPHLLDFVGNHQLDPDMVSLWNEYAKFSVKSIDQTNMIDEMNELFVSVPMWCSSKQYRELLSQFFDFKDNQSNIEYDNQYKNLEISKEETKLLIDQEFLFLSQQIFPETPIVNILKNYQLKYQEKPKNEEIFDSISQSKSSMEKKQSKSLLEFNQTNIKSKSNTPESELLNQKQREDSKLSDSKAKLLDSKVKNNKIPTPSPVHHNAIKPPVILEFPYNKNVKSGQRSLGISMIVKNEVNIIERCLSSIVKYLDYWVIHDTGSTDGTQEKIIEFFRKHQIPGELHYMPWKNFGWNRTQAIRMAKLKTDYVALLDADFVVHVNDPSFKSDLKQAGYLIRYLGGLDYRQILLISSDFNWEYYGVTHEYIDTKPNQQPVEIVEFFNMEHTGMGSNRSEKYSRDVELLIQGIKDEPDNSRYYFYLAQSYKDWGRYDQAIEQYNKRISFGNWDEEIFYSLYQIGMCQKRRGDDFYQYMGSFLKAHRNRPHRIEPLYQILEDCAYDSDKAVIGYQIDSLNQKLNYPSRDLLFIEKPLYDWMYLDILATCAYTAKLYWEAFNLTKRILNENKFPQSEGSRFLLNYGSLQKKVMQLSSNGLTKEIHPYNFVRINYQQPNVKRVAVLIANYNMSERANNLVKKIFELENNCGQKNIAIDIIVIDNGSDLIQPSRYTGVHLVKNVQTTHAWTAGLRYADSLEKTENIKYDSYVFMITSAEVVSQCLPKSGFISVMLNALLDNDQLVGVHPALTVDSTTYWQNLIVDLPLKIQNMDSKMNIIRFRK